MLRDPLNFPKKDGHKLYKCTTKKIRKHLQKSFQRTTWKHLIENATTTNDPLKQFHQEYMTAMDMGIVEPQIMTNIMFQDEIGQNDVFRIIQPSEDEINTLMYNDSLIREKND